jgi:hypothetical protein
VIFGSVHGTTVPRWRVAEREAAVQAPKARDRDDVADVRAILRRADQIGLDRWRVLVALEVPASTRQRLLKEIDGENGDFSRQQPGRAENPG